MRLQHALARGEVKHHGPEEATISRLATNWSFGTNSFVEQSDGHDVALWPETGGQPQGFLLHLSLGTKARTKAHVWESKVTTRC